ncbi:hypothetical protein Y032_0021g298 [Ancylostoma ceylanicum]|uniref:Uncharacterized protein n=1 Tax=Ancylostoma ceylanicum TaxID=53326 RepID=A0A016V1K8_9BILA|nr:hypothetical protein Y032_0021g298 [Ancylostoma ceylanicum]
MSCLLKKNIYHFAVRVPQGWDTVRKRDSYSELHTVVDKGKGAVSLRVCPAGLQPRDSRQPECPHRRSGPCLRPFGVYCITFPACYF